MNTRWSAGSGVYDQREPRSLHDVLDDYTRMRRTDMILCSILSLHWEYQRVVIAHGTSSC